MLIFQIDEMQIKDLMNKILKESTFDKFEARNIEILSFTKFEISGELDKSFISTKDVQQINRNFCTWNEIRPYILNLIKGNNRPKYIKIIFSIPNEDVCKIHKNANAMFLNFHFHDNTAIFTTAISEKIFSLDKIADTALDNYILNFFKQNNLNIKLID